MFEWLHVLPMFFNGLNGLAGVLNFYFIYHARSEDAALLNWWELKRDSLLRRLYNSNFYSFALISVYLSASEKDFKKDNTLKLKTEQYIR